MKVSTLFRAAVSAVFLVVSGPALAGLKTVKVTDTVYALVGDKGQRSPENFANNATFGVIVTEDGVVLVDAGGSYKGAEEIEAAIEAITDQSVKVVINTGGQDHRWLGNSYWAAQGARLIASEAAVEDQKARASMEQTMLSQLIGDSLKGTDPVYALETFAEDLTLFVGGREIRVVHAGPAHTPGDSFVWLPDDEVVFTGDIVFAERLLGVLEMSNSAGWMASFEAIEALNPEHVVPGHGDPTTLAKAKADTYDYLANLREKIRAYIDDGGDIIGSVDVDQSAFSHLENFDTLAKRNAQQVFTEMEWE
ncbi:MBL fold metallo-hydrolase [uncultured Roseibium sp.]|uniref:MBL fold metallo-hydrolase n=1 Tax=uncultured Roseibium sp. TaxID=1936171 RepID=UPI003216E378